MKHLNALLLFLCMAHITSAQQLNIPKGKKFYYQTSNNNKLMNDLETYSYSFFSKGKNAEGNTVLECSIVKALLKNQGITYFNTDSLRNTSFRSTAVFFPLAMLNQPFTVIVSPKGKVLKVEGVEQTLQNALDKWRLSPDISKNIVDNVKGNFGNTLQQMFFQFPEKDMQKSPEWENKDSGFSFKLNTNTPKSRIVSSTKKGEKDMLHRNKYALDPITGMIRNAAEQYSFTATSVTNGDTTSSKAEVLNTQKLLNNVMPVKNDPVWTEMAIMFSYWSRDLKSATGYDSAKVANAFKTYDQKFSTDRQYMLSKLGLIQQMRSKNSYKVYDSLLLLTPNKYLEGTHHLFNKLGEALDKKGPSAAYDVSKYVYKESSFNEWIQHSMSQSFLSYDNKPNPSAGRAYELLGLFMKDKDPLYQDKVKPLYLWVTAEREPQHKALAIKNAAEFIKMTDAQMHNGNGGRYALLLYGILAKAKAQTEADALLNHTIKKLEKYATDVKNPYRYAEQNMLAHAWYLKYQLTLSKDSTKALEYLGKAANYSPKTNNEKAHGSFYDRVFLKSKESYRQEYIDQLLKSGDEQQALKLIAVNINANPENLSEMQKVYKDRFPGKNFKSFFTQEVLASWNTAPDFKLKNIDGKEHSLTDYKNKWLVLDFWGTWCGPCKEELPSVNKFYTELAAGKHGDNNFLSIACRDQEDKVKAFVAQNKYSIPVAMSDDKIEYNYKITGYPSKILISPEGKMINIQFGKDWKAILKQLNAVYAIN